MKMRLAATMLAETLPAAAGSRSFYGPNGSYAGSSIGYKRDQAAYGGAT
jgi:hypothetical protein